MNQTTTAQGKESGFRILDLQIAGRYFADGAVFKTREDIMEQLADYHSIDYEGVKENNEPYEDIWEFLGTLENDDVRLNWLLEYGEWEIEPTP